MKNFLFLIGIAIAHVGGAQFLPPTSLAIDAYNMGSSFLGDLDNDGDEDVVQTDISGIDLRIFWNTNGLFTLQVLSNAQSLQGGCYASGDFDEDGDIDLACSTGWLENENFNFTNSHNYNPGSVTGGMIVCEDVNGDSHLDLLLGIGDGPYGGNDENHFYSLLNDGLGNFVASNTPAEELRVFSLVDIDQDGFKDMVTHQSYPYELRCSYNNGDGTFQPYSVLISNFDHIASGIADLNGDMLEDVFGVNGNILKIYHGLPEGGLSPEVVYMLNANFTACFDCASNLSTDYDGDGDIDLILRTSYHQLHFIENTGVGFTEHGNILTRPANPMSFNWIDLNNDGKMDGVESSSTFYSVIQHEDGILYTNQMQAGSGVHCGHSFEVFDLNEDGTMDLLSRGEVGWVGFANDGYSNYSSLLMGLTALQYSVPVIFTDFDRDGQKDLLTGFDSGANCSIRKDAQHFKPSKRVLPDLGINDQCWAFLEADVNLDNDPDLLVFARSNGIGKVTWYDYDEIEGWILQTVLADLGNFGLGNYRGEGLQKGDFNGDSIQDFTVDGYVLEGDGMGNYEVIEAYDPPCANCDAKFSDNSVGDINGDGRDDIVFAEINFDNDQIKILYIAFDGTNYTTTEAVSFTNSPPIDSYCIADFDGDSDIDIVYGISSELKIISNDSNGTFGAPVSLNFTTMHDGLRQLSAAMMDDDNMPDLVLSGNDTGSAVSWLSVAINNLDSPFQIQFNIFIDTNGNGVQDSGELPMSNQQIYLGEEWGYVFTDENGQFHFLGSEGITTASINLDTDLWSFTTSSIQSVELTLLSPTAEMFFGIQPIGVQHAVSSSISTSGELCGGAYTQWLSVTNNGNTIANGTVTYTLDELYTYSGATPVPSSVNGNTIIWELSSLHYSESFQIELLVFAPSFEFMGMEASHSMSTDLFDDLNNIVFTDQIELLHTIQCSYDPNDLLEQLGETEEGYILPTGELEYRIRFQNMGNGPAGYVRIEDQLSNRLDWTTLQVVGYSDPYIVEITPVGKAIFIFEDIILPPSTTDELGSQGFITFRIQPLDDVMPGEVIENTAEIFFDLNPAILTNSEQNTIYDCVDLEQVSATMTEACVGEILAFSSNAIWLEELVWQFEGTTVSGNNYEHTLNESGTLTMTANNSLCEYSQSWELAAQITLASFTANGNSLIANEASSYQWFLNGNEIPGATSQAFEITQTGNYSVEITDGSGCIDLSDELIVIYTRIGEIMHRQVPIYPNPAKDFINLNSRDFTGSEVFLCDVTGRMITSIGIQNAVNQIVDISAIPNGTYLLRTSKGDIGHLIILH
ncbi:MAG: FG-GAP-like repeat-containing protein [Flavobacteriales bacterium]